MVGKTRQFPAWLQRTITIMAVLGGAWYLIGSWWTWLTTPLSGAG